MEKFSVLIVESHDDVRALIVTMLEDDGFRAESMHTAMDALHRMEAHPPIDLVIIDAHARGGMDGVALTKRLRSRYPNLPLIVISADWYGFKETGLSRVRFLSKPFAVTQLLEAVAEAQVQRMLNSSKR
jgi:CheY-like chemotaxis protein